MIGGFTVVACGRAVSMIPYDKPAFRDERHTQIAVEVTDTKISVQFGELYVGGHARGTFRSLVFGRTDISQDVTQDVTDDSEISGAPGDYAEERCCANHSPLRRQLNDVFGKPRSAS